MFVVIRERYTYRLKILSIRLDNLDPLFIAKDHLGVLEEVLADDEELSAAVDVALRERLLVDLRRAQRLGAVLRRKDRRNRMKRGFPLA